MKNQRDVTMTSRYAGPGGNCAPGAKITLDSEEAESIVKAGSGEFADEAVKKATKRMKKRPEETRPLTGPRETR